MVRNGATFDHQSDEILGVARIENPIHNGPQATVLGDMALQRCWHAWIQDLVAHRRKEAAEVGEIKGVLRIRELRRNGPQARRKRRQPPSQSRAVRRRPERARAERRRPEENGVQNTISRPASVATDKHSLSMATATLHSPYP